MKILNTSIFCSLLTAQALKSDLDCSRRVSRNVLNLLQKEVFSVLSINFTDLPKDCPLNPKRDVFYDQEIHRIKRKERERKCGYCRKVFVNDFYLDRHMDKMHRDKLTNNSVCFGSLCPIFGCNEHEHGEGENERHIHTHHRERDGARDQEGGSFRDIQQCNSQELEKNKHLCDSIMRRCFHSLADSERLEKYFWNKICNKLQCVEGRLQGSYKEEEPSTNFFAVALFTLRCIGLVSLVAFLALYIMGAGLGRIRGQRNSLRPAFQFNTWRTALKKKNF